MGKLALLSVFLALLSSIASPARGAGEMPALKCDVGPLTRAYGGAAWLVYSCHDDKSLTFVAAPGSPAAPFYFTLYVKDGVYQLVGEGTGDKKTTDAAYAELGKLSTTQILQLIVQTKKAGTKPAASAASATGPLHDQLVGHWSYRDQFGDIDLFFGADGSFSGTVRKGGKLLWTYGGDWTLEGARIVYHYTLSNPRPEKVGMFDMDTVQDMTADCFTLISASTDVSRACRVP